MTFCEQADLFALRLSENGDQLVALGTARAVETARGMIEMHMKKVSCEISPLIFDMLSATGSFQMSVFPGCVTAVSRSQILRKKQG